MILDIIVRKSDDGFTAEVLSLKGCESWAHSEDDVLDKILELAAFYLKTDIKKFKLDKARVLKSSVNYKLVIDNDYK